MPKVLFGDTERPLCDGDQLVFSRDASGYPTCVRRAASSGDMPCEAPLRFRRRLYAIPLDNTQFAQWVDDMVDMASAVTDLASERVDDGSPDRLIFRFYNYRHVT